MPKNTQRIEVRALTLEQSHKGVQTSDGPIRANRFADSLDSLDLRESPEASRTEPLRLFFANRVSGQ